MAVTVYKSTDASAPALSGSAGALAAVLDACLIDGYGAKSAAGWGIEYTAANKRVYRAAAGNGNRYYLRLDDAGTTTGLLRAYETMSDIDTGTNPFPNTTQSAAGLAISKSNAASAAVRPWIIIATPVFFYIFIDLTEVAFATGSFLCSYFGDFVSYKSGGETYNTIICINNGSLIGNPSYLAATVAANNYNFLARKYDGISISGTGEKSPISGLQGVYQQENMGIRNSVIYPETLSGKLFCSPLYVCEYLSASGIILRGWLPGLWAPCHYIPLTHGDTFTGVAGSSAEGKTFEVIKSISATSATVGQCFMEISDTWTGVNFV